MALSRVEESIAYPLLSVGYVVNALPHSYLFGEAVTARCGAPVSQLIILGVFIVARS
jgi:multidrug transporter EmrE-like cation transporter